MEPQDTQGTSNDQEINKQPEAAAPGTAQPTQNSNVLPPQGKLPQDHGKKAKIVAVIIMLLVLLGGVAAYFFILRDDSSQQTAGQTDTPTDAGCNQADEAEKVTCEITEAVESQFSYARARSVDEGGRSVGFPYKPANADYYVYAAQEDLKGAFFANTNYDTQEDVGIGEGDDEAEQNEKVLDFVNNQLVSAGFEEVGGQIPTDSEFYEISKMFMNSVTSVICYTSSFWDGEGVALGCAAEGSFQKSVDRVEEFVEAYRRDSDDDSVYTAIDADESRAEASKTEGYKTLTGSIQDVRYSTGGAAALFYQTPDGVWHFFTGTQAALGCDEYDTEDLKKAYLGTACFDENGEEQTVAL